MTAGAGRGRAAAAQSLPQFENVTHVTQAMAAATIEGDEIPTKVMPAKMGPATIGKPVNITTNAYEVDTSKLHNVPWFRYELTIEEKHKKNNVTKDLTMGAKNDTMYIKKQSTCYNVFIALAMQNPGFFGADIRHLVYDCSRTLNSKNKLPFAHDDEVRELELSVPMLAELCKEIYRNEREMKLDLNIRDHTESFIVRIWQAFGKDGTHTVVLNNLDDVVRADVANRDRSSVQFVENAMRAHVRYSDKHVFLSNSMFEKSSMNAKPISDGMDVKQGLTESVRAVEGEKGGEKTRLVVNVDVKTCAFFHAGPVMDLVQKYCNAPKDIQRVRKADVNNLLRDMAMSISSKWYTRTFVCAGITHEPIQKLWQEENGEQKSVVQMYADNGVVLRNTNLWALIEQCGPKKRYHAIELCTIEPHQRVSIQKQKASTMRDMIKLAALDPIKRQAKVAQLLQQTEAFSNDTLKALDLAVKPTPIAVTGCVLPKPDIEYGGGKRCTVAEDGTWRMPKCQFIRPMAMPEWAVLVVHEPHEQASAMGQRLTPIVLEGAGSMVAHMRMAGMTVKHKPMKRALSTMAMPSEYDNMFKMFKSSNVKFVLVCGGETDTHEQIKLNEGKYAITTQHILTHTLNDSKFGRFTVGNVIAKTNMKLGGLNYSVDAKRLNLPKDFASTIQFIGIDVNHPAPLSAYQRRQGIEASEPSVVGFAYSVKDMEMRGNIVFQECRKENTDGVLKPLFEQAVAQYYKHNQRMPATVHVLRDGVSTGQYGSDVYAEEIAFRTVLKKMAPNTKLIITIVTKRHNMRIYDIARQRRAGERARAPDLNVLPGTFICSGVVDPEFPEFYICPHKALQGTAKPPRCTLHTNDDKTLTTDKWIAQVYALAFAHDVVTSTISLPAPVYCAHNLAKRGKLLLKALKRSSDSSSEGDSAVHSRSSSMSSSGGGGSLHGIEVDLTETNTELNYYTMPHFMESKFWA